MNSEDRYHAPGVPEQEPPKSVNGGDFVKVFRLELEPGDYRLQADFSDENGVVRGAYYVTIFLERQSPS